MAVSSRVACLCSLSLVFLVSAAGQTTAYGAPVLVIDAQAPSHPFPHFWEHMFGSGRAVLSLRESYRQDLRSVKTITDFEYVRFHAIFHDEVGVYDEDAQGDSVYNFSYVDQIYDGLLANGIRPFVELSFMPNKLAAQDIRQAFWYKPNVSPPKDWKRWEELIHRFVEHLVDRYGEQEVGQWYFEVWNEPNIDFWGGEPKQETYWELYDHTARAVKQVSPRLRVGGPATAQAAWVDAFLEHCAANHVPVDFVSTHVYANDTAADVFGTNETIPREAMVCRAVAKVHDQIRASVLPHLPLIFSEYNASYKNEPEITDSVYMGPWLANTIRLCDGLVDEMSYWTFSDVFEEQGVVKQPFYGGFGLMAAGGIPKPSYRAFRLLHQLGNARLELDSDSALLTRRGDGSLVLALWNLVPPGQSGTEKVVRIRTNPPGRFAQATISRVDRDHGDPYPAYRKMGSPVSPTETQLRELRQVAESPVPEVRKFADGELTLSLPSEGLAILELK
ncbi:MAG TPA: glycosyl hydrolase family 39 [Terriglobales bacterium]|nr:glycosyl hydrolase family 39 [Terriglobales bacterium]